MRWLFHVVREADLVWHRDDAGVERYAPVSLAREGFIHASYKDAVLESARLYFPAGERLRVLAIDPRRLDVPVDVASTPRGPMPHIEGALPRAAVNELALADVPSHADLIDP